MLKRLAASVVLASREMVANAQRHRVQDAAQCRPAESYQLLHMREYAEMTALDVWYSHLDARTFIDKAKSSAAKKRWRKVERKAKLQTAGRELPKITAVQNGHRRIIDRPPLIYHPPEIASIGKRVRKMFQRYRLTPLPREKRVGAGSLPASWM